MRYYVHKNKEYQKKKNPNQITRIGPWKIKYHNLLQFPSSLLRRRQNKVIFIHANTQRVPPTQLFSGKYLRICSGKIKVN